RFFRWDRTGIIVSARFNYCDQHGLLLEFFRRYSLMSPAARGHDPTVRLATPEEVAIAQVALAGEGYKDRIDPKYPTRAMEVYDENLELTSTFLVGKPEVMPSSLIGRATKAYIAVDTSNHKVVFLKDCWRVSTSDMEKECDTVRQLNDAAVPNVPQLLCGGDVGGTNAQPTGSYNLIKAPWRCGNRKVTPHTHYRQVVDVVGKTIHGVTSSRQLVQVILDALQAHRVAFEQCKILHRDVSAGNILITREGRGLLNDWDMAKPVDTDVARQPDRTGTWLFLSTRMLQNPNKIHEIQDDMESFVHVFIYIALVY
ncbi:hypothetical protein BJ138DRAFT_987575, partial [Hygrophoropsis aurantiaca]